MRKIRQKSCKLADRLLTLGWDILLKDKILRIHIQTIIV